MKTSYEILNQLGGNRFRAMTGARDFIDIGNGLRFSLPGPSGFVKNGINRVRIALNGNDLYDVEFARYRAGAYKVIAELKDVGVEDLAHVFRENTGLETRMPRVVGL